MAPQGSAHTTDFGGPCVSLDFARNQTPLMPASVLLYTTDWCPYCHRAKSLLSRKNVAFEEIDVEGRPELRQWLTRASGQSTVPQVFINSRPIGGFTELSRLDSSGKLDPLLAQDPPPDVKTLPR